MTPAYQPLRPAQCRHVPVRGLPYHLHQWGAPQPGPPLLVMVHGFMDVGASFQFVVDALARAGDGERCVVAPDWRGFGRSASLPGADAFWFPDYLGDLDALLDLLSPDAPVDLLGHSMGGNVVMAYAGVRPQRIRRLVNLEGFGLPDMPAAEAPRRMADWLDDLKKPQRLKPYASLADVAARLQKNNPRLPADKALWLAAQWAAPDAGGDWQLLADPAHRRINPLPLRANDTIATWQCITAPLLWVQAAGSRVDSHWGGRYSLAEFQQRLSHVASVRQVALENAGHMLHHDQPEALAAALRDFLA
jgi:pimeloyl-ACP methyl ester carboxylesterase